MLLEMKYHFQQGQERMKFNHDKRRRELKFKIGDLVYIKRHPYRQHSILALPSKEIIHNVFHFSILKQAPWKKETTDPSLLANVTSHGAYVVFPQTILMT